MLRPVDWMLHPVDRKLRPVERKLRPGARMLCPARRTPFPPEKTPFPTALVTRADHRRDWDGTAGLSGAEPQSKTPFPHAPFPRTAVNGRTRAPCSSGAGIGERKKPNRPRSAPLTSDLRLPLPVRGAWTCHTGYLDRSLAYYSCASLLQMRTSLFRTQILFASARLLRWPMQSQRRR